MSLKNIYTLQEIQMMNETAKILRYKAKDIQNKKFYHYTTADAAEKILQKDERGNCFFFVSNLQRMNDRNEARLHKANGNRIHCLCLCSTRHEKIPPATFAARCASPWRPTLRGILA